MKVYLGYQCYYNGCDEFANVVKVFDCEVKALVWVEEFVPNDPESESRRYEERVVE
jgi:hypothetical protein